MPTFSKNGNDEYICQKCARIFDSVEQPSQWRPDITGHTSAGNVCPSCVQKHETTPISLAEHCRQESGGLEGVALQRYINRYYGHG
jgi:hypothetical protein